METVENKGLVDNLEDTMVPEDNEEVLSVLVKENDHITPTKESIVTSQPTICMPPINHNWDCCDSGKWVESGRLSGGLKCIGIRNDRICERLFVSKTLTDGTHQSETEFHPTSRKPGYGCTKCNGAMCKECHDHYEQYTRQSPARTDARMKREEFKKKAL